jgi:hypothetical protein
MVLSTDQRIEELGSGEAHTSDFATFLEAIDSCADKQASDAKQFHSPCSDPPNYPNVAFKSDNNHPESTDAFFFDKIEKIKQVIIETISEMKSRQQLNEFFIQGIDTKIANFLHELDELKHWSLGNNPSIETRRIHLEKELLQLEKEKRINNLTCWRDLLLLKKELRDALSEYKTLIKFKEIFS